MVHRSVNLLALVALAVLTWARSPPGPPLPDPPLSFIPETMPPVSRLAPYLGPLRLEGAWIMRPANEKYYGYSALAARPDGSLLAFNDAGGTLQFLPPGVGPGNRDGASSRASRHVGASRKQAPMPALRWVQFRPGAQGKATKDVESYVSAPDGGYWLGLEGRNEIVRFGPDGREVARVAPPPMAGWGVNTGPEAMTLLPDGRFIALREITTSIFEPRRHEAVVFDGDPLVHPDGRRFWFAGADNFSAVDMAMLPDGRALILMRRLLWPAPLRFAGRIVIADTRQIRAGAVWPSVTVASLGSVLPVDNFEAMAVVPQPDGRVVVWIMSDDNLMHTMQRTLLWKLSVDPAQLPWPKD